MRERTFTRDDKTVTTSTPSAATQLIAEGWREVSTWPTERPEPPQRGDVVPTTPGGHTTGAVVPVESRSARRRRAVSETGEMPPTETE